MRCSVLLVLSVLGSCWGGAAGAAAACGLAEEFFQRHGASADDGQLPGPVCGGQCCGHARESQLRSSLQRAAVAPAAAAVRPIADLLLATRRTLQGHLTALSYQSQNKSAFLFVQTYKGQAARAHAPVNALYEDIRAMIRANSTADDLTSSPPKDLVQSTRKFFRDIFPVVYHVMLKLDAKQFTTEYEVCLKDAYDAVKPFDDLPQQVETSLSKSLEVARTLLQVLAAGAGALAASEEILASTSSQCSAKLLRAAGCPRCKDSAAKPCRNYCLNLARGCVGSLVSGLDLPWAGYVEGVEKLARADTDSALRALDERVTKAVMYAIENRVQLEKKVNQECGSPFTTEIPGPATPRPTPAARRDTLRAPPPDTEMLQFAASLAASKRLFAGLADRVCDLPDFAHDGNENCYDGVAVGSYTKPLVKSASLDDQRYNPELQGGATLDPRLAAIDDKLRKATQLLTAQAWSTPTAESIMQGDEANGEGSGSGHEQQDVGDDDDYDAEGSGDEGSGRAPDLGGKATINEEPAYHSPPTTGAGAAPRPAAALVLAALLAAAKHLT